MESIYQNLHTVNQDKFDNEIELTEMEYSEYQKIKNNIDYQMRMLDVKYGVTECPLTELQADNALIQLHNSYVRLMKIFKNKDIPFIKV